MLTNTLRSCFRNRQTAYGLWITLESPAVTEIAAAFGLAWVCIDMEHGHLGYREVIDHLRAVRGSETTPLVRVPQLGQSEIKRALDIGAHGVIVPWIGGRADAEAAQRFGRYPPAGVRGVGGERAYTWGLGTAEYLASADEQTLIIPLIETPGALREIEEILALPDLAAIFFGPADLSSTHGHLGQWEGPGIAERILAVREQAVGRGIASGILARSVGDAQLRRDQGFGMVGLGSDTGLLIRALKATLEDVQGSAPVRFWF
jgi:2-dehydro-3-deoxyglucarate aldolase/4-hydroxy-2-oxoheptanedioate aldolase